MADQTSCLGWVHFGDLHLTAADAARTQHFQALIGLVNRRFAGRVDFAFLLGDSADNGTAAQFALARDARAIRLQPSGM